MTKRQRISEAIKWLKTPIETDFMHWLPSIFSETIIVNKEFKSIKLDYKKLDVIDFKKCKFIECSIDNAWFSNVGFDNVIFDNCTFEYTKFTTCEFNNCEFNNCRMIGVEIASSYSANVALNDCPEILDLNIRAGGLNEFKFFHCFIAYFNIESYFFQEPLKCDLVFQQCYIEKSNFEHIDLTSSRFNHCLIIFNSFVFCILSNKTLLNENGIEETKYNLIDLRTLIDSNQQQKQILQELFGIFNEEIKDYLLELTSKVYFHSTFISYSFKDRKIAQRINVDLHKRGITTFLWEKDAPSGKYLKQIMELNIHAKDRVLFIASENSIKSTACHFELSEACKKQDKEWKVVLFPIHIDNYLFEVKKHEIRPLSKQEEYWLNLEELKMINSIDFSQCFDSIQEPTSSYYKALDKLVEGLKKELRPTAHNGAMPAK